MLKRNKIAYMPIDRAIALFYNQPIPEVCFGTALFADVSGFTVMAEALRRTMGERDGAEVLMRHMDTLFETLIQIVHDYGGSVVGFSGDAITCWFYSQHHGNPRQSALRAVSASLEMHRVMEKTPTIHLPDKSTVNLSMKVALASGSVRRLLVGDPEIQVIDTLVGKTITRMAEGEQIARQGETLADEVTIDYLGDDVRVQSWRKSEVIDARFGIITQALRKPDTLPWALINDEDLSEIILNQWLLPRVQMQLDANLGEFKPELRQAVALFMRFTGLDYDDDPDVQTKLNQFICWVQEILVRYDGNLLQLTFGDKGSYLYAAFGAPISHENNTYRAVSAGLELSKTSETFNMAVQIGVSTGMMRSGAYGGALRRTYGVQGDEVNIAARLMTHAETDTMLVSQLVYEQIKDSFNITEKTAIALKGHTNSIKVATVRSRNFTTMDTITMASIKMSPVIGRQREMDELRNAIIPIFSGRFAGSIHIGGEIGMGKSRLIAELRHELESAHAIQWLPVPCDPTNRVPLAPFAFLINKIFDQMPDEDEAHNRARFNNAFRGIITKLSQAESIPLHIRPALINELERTRPLLARLIGVTIEAPYNNYSLIGDLALANLISGLKTLIQSMSLLHPLIIHVQESNWVDEDSRYLLNELAQSWDEYPLALILSSRYADDGTRQSISVGKKHRHKMIDLLPLGDEDIRTLMEQQLRGAISLTLLDVVMKKCNGNPFFTEQFIQDLREQGKIIRKRGQWELIDDESTMELPAGTQSVLMARIDRLTPDLRALVQTASVLGTEFEITILEMMLDYAPDIRVKVIEGIFAGIWVRVDKDTYRFKHSLVCDAAYAMQERVHLRELHQRAAMAIQTLHPNDRTRKIELTHHLSLANEE